MRGRMISKWMAGLMSGIVVLLLCGLPALAQSRTSCDPEYMQALNARGLIEARRETAQARNLIYKPDSVLEYSCFYGALNHFENTSSINIPGQYYDEVIRNALQDLVYINFGHTYLGGRINRENPGVPLANFGLCDALARVWEFARCINFNSYQGADDFFDFSWYMENDPRIFPEEYARCESSVLALELQTAFNGMHTQFTLSPEPQLNEQPYRTDPIGPLRDYPIYPLVGDMASYDISCARVAPIPTGLVIFRPGGNPEEYIEHICAVPGCTYVPQSRDSGTCE